MKLFLKGDKCLGQKCPLERRNYPPGQHGRLGPRRRGQSEYEIRFREKQRLKRMYGILERQFRNYFEMAEGKKGVTGENLLILLERRLDNVVYRMGFAKSRAMARQLVNHGHICVNGRKMDIPSYLVKIGDRISVAEGSRDLDPIKESLESASSHIPPWLDVDVEGMTGVVLRFPTRDEILVPIKEQLVVEFYSR
jgi:small subunit ribosomal protein S4